MCVYSLVSFSVVNCDENSEFQIRIIRRTASLASYEAATIFCDNIRILYLETQRDNYYEEQAYNITRYDRRWYRLSLGTTFLLYLIYYL